MCVVRLRFFGCDGGKVIVVTELSLSLLLEFLLLRLSPAVVVCYGHLILTTLHIRHQFKMASLDGSNKESNGLMARLLANKMNLFYTLLIYFNNFAYVSVYPILC